MTQANGTERTTKPATRDRNPYHEHGKEPTLRASVFAFLDILGYEDLIRRAVREKRTQQILRKLHSTLDEARVWVDANHKADPEDDPVFSKDRYALKAFTDNITVGWPIRDDAESELVQALDNVAWFQLNMIHGGFFVRGSIVIGDVYVDEIAVFGDALLEAYEAESSLARDPRIIVTKSAMNVAKRHLEYYANPEDSPHAQFILQDADGQSFVNYLEPTVMVAVNENGPDTDMLKGHKVAVEEKLDEYRSDPPKWSKYAWVADYHNYFCSRYAAFGLMDFKIDPARYTRPGPASIVSPPKTSASPASNR